MTTIAWDGETLAADRGAWAGGVRRTARKVYKVRSSDGRVFLVGFAGSSVFCLTVLAWMRGSADIPEPHAFMSAENILGSACAVVIDERRKVWLLNNNLIYEPMLDRIFAFGAGQEFAWGALEAGATAKRAIQIAIRRSDYAAMGVDCVRF